VSGSVRKHGARVAVIAFALITVLTVLRPAFLLLADEALSPSNLGGFVLYAFPVVGVLVALHRPGNAIARLCLTIGMVWALEGAFWGGALYAMEQGWDPTSAGLLATLGDSFVMPGLFLMATLLLLLFPDGRLPSPGWRWLALLSGASIASIYFLSLFSSEPWGWGRPDYDNPLAIGSASGYEAVLVAVSLPGFFCVAASVAALIRRYQRSTGMERLQLKWLVAAGALAVCVWPTTILLIEFHGISEGAATAIAVGVFLLFPTAIGLAVLRYRLYDIDRLINRTLVYGFLTAGLATTYFLFVVGLQSLLRSVNGGSDLAIVITTLVIAALFLPARRRVQDAVDRRFNRRSYDAARTIDAFSARLRQQIDFDTLRYELLAVVDETMQPEKASLWLRKA
jgi:hypothetical protein